MLYGPWVDSPFHQDVYIEKQIYVRVGYTGKGSEEAWTVEEQS